MTIKRSSGPLYNDPVIYLYSVTYTNCNNSSDNSFKLVSMGVAMDLQSKISNLFNISTAYFH